MKRVLVSLSALVILAGACGPLAGRAPVSPPEMIPEVATVPPGVTVTPAPGLAQATPTESYNPFADERPLSQIGFMLPPTVQHVTDTVAEILFQFEVPQPGILVYRPVADPPSPTQSLPLDPLPERHVVRLEGLTPGSTYEFVVRLGDGPLETLNDVPFQGTRWGVQTFRTPPYVEPLRFAVIGDSGFAEPVTFTLAQEIADFDPYFVLHTGDVVYHAEDYPSPGEAFQAAYYAPFKPVLQRAPIYPVVGNHDLDPPTFHAGAAFYYLAFPPFSDADFPPSDVQGRRQWYAFAANDVQFIALNTQTFFGEPGRKEQLDWFEEQLADPRFAYSVVFAHVPPYSSSSVHPEDGVAVSEVAALVEGAGVPLVFTGHVHAYERLSAGPTTYFISGGGSGVIYAPGEGRHPNSQVFVSQSHYLQVEITSDLIVVRAVAADGSLIDEVSLPAPP